MLPSVEASPGRCARSHVIGGGGGNCLPAGLCQTAVLPTDVTYSHCFGCMVWAWGQLLCGLYMAFFALRNGNVGVGRTEGPH